MTVNNINITPRMLIGKGGSDIISFGSGQPDLSPPPDVRKVLLNHTEFRYGDVSGEYELRAELRGYVKEEFGCCLTPDCFVVTNGASEGIDLFLRHLSLSGSRKNVLLVKPYYYSYPELVRLNHMKPIYTDDEINLEDVNEKSKKCCAMIINSPANPSGKIIQKRTLSAIQEITEDNGCMLISDEVYHSLTYGERHHHVSGDNVLSVNSFSKTYSLCGYRVGYMFSDDDKLMCKMSDMKAHTSMNTNILAQRVALACLRTPRAYINRNRETFRKRRNHIYAKIVELGLEVEKPGGAFYILPRVKDSMKVSTELYHKHKVVTYPGEWFGAPGHIRMSFALDVERIDEGMKRMKRYLAMR